jgi:hypothetical protein
LEIFLNRLAHTNSADEAIFLQEGGGRAESEGVFLQEEREETEEELELILLRLIRIDSEMRKRMRFQTLPFLCFLL